MNAPRLRLPIRLLPRKLPFVLLFVFFGLFFAFAVIWIVASLQPETPMKLNGAEVTDPLIRHLFPFFGLPFCLFGAGGLAVCIARLLPRSPYCHVEISAEGLRVRTLTKPQHFRWQDLPAFEALEVVTTDSDGTTRNHFAAAIRPDAPAHPPGAKQDPREVVKISAGEYGRKNTQEQAQILADWLNHLRERGLKLRLHPGDEIEIPETLRKVAIGVPTQSNQAQRIQTVERR